MPSWDFLFGVASLPLPVVYFVFLAIRLRRSRSWPHLLWFPLLLKSALAWGFLGMGFEDSDHEFPLWFVTGYGLAILGVVTSVAIGTWKLGRPEQTLSSIFEQDR